MRCAVARTAGETSYLFESAALRCHHNSNRPKDCRKFGLSLFFQPIVCFDVAAFLRSAHFCVTPPSAPFSDQFMFPCARSGKPLAKLNRVRFIAVNAATANERRNV